jgi:hypothetical protein
MPCRKSKRATTFRQQPNALSALDVFTMRAFQHQWALSAVNSTNSRMMLLQSMDLEVEGEDDDLFMVLYHHHHSILKDMNFLSTVDSLFMNINEDDIIPRNNVFNRNRTLNLLRDSWAYANTCFNVAQLSELYFRLQLPATFIISQRGHKASSEEAFIITLTKIASSKTNVDLTEVFGATTDTFIGRVYSFFLEVLDNKADGIIHVNCLQRWIHLFPAFSDVIKNKLNRPQYGELLFESVRIIGFLDCKIDET